MGCLLIGGLFFFVIMLFGVDPTLGTLALIGLIGTGIYFSINDSKKQKELVESKTNKIGELINKLGDFNITNKVISYDLHTALLLDEVNSKIAIIRSEGEYVKSYNYNELLESEVVEDGVTVNKTSRSSQIGGAILGGVLAGGVGAIIGGLSGSSTSSQEVNSIDLKIVVNDIEEPVFIVNFTTADVIDLNGKPFPIKKDSDKYKGAIKNANYWHSLISVLIKRADKEDKQIESKQNMSNSIADEIKKLNDLVKEGILSDDEFREQKTKLLEKQLG